MHLFTQILYQVGGGGGGGESHDLFLLFCTCIWTDRVRKLFFTSLILNKFSCRNVQIPCLHEQQTNTEVFYVMHCSFYTVWSKDFLSLLEVMWKNTACMETSVR